MVSTRVLMIAAFVCFVPTQAKRTAMIVKQHRSTENDDASPSLNATGGSLEDFETWAATNKVGGLAKIIGSLIRGVKKADNPFAGVVWSPPSDGKAELKLQLNVDNLYGEIATPSRLPTMWVLAKEVTFRFLSTESYKTAHVSGLAIGSSAQALELYKAVLQSKFCKKKGCNPTKCEGSYESIPPCLQAEVEAAGEYLNANWKQMQKDPRKITAVLQTSYGKGWLFRKTVNMFSPGIWGKTFYNMIISGTSQVTAFTLLPGDLVALSQKHIEVHGSEALHMKSKSDTMGLNTLRSVATNLGKAKSFASSGTNLGLSLNYGDPIRRKLMMENVPPLPAGELKVIAKILTHCEKESLGQCVGSSEPGRLHWTEDVPATMK